MSPGPTRAGLRPRHLALLPLAVALVLSLWSSPASADHRFGREAGWEKARTEPRRSVLVWADPGLRIDLPAVIRPWNRLAGRSLFRIVETAARADVLFRPSEQTWVECDPAYGHAYTRCVVWSATAETATHRHEIGHALGFADHVRAALGEEETHVRAGVCDDPTCPAYRRYRGVMSYCDWGGAAWFRPEDEAMLARAGYRAPGAGPRLSASPSGAAAPRSPGSVPGRGVATLLLPLAAVPLAVPARRFLGVLGTAR